MSKYLTNLGYKCFSAPPKYHPQWDIQAVKPDGTKIHFEVKMDMIGMFLNARSGFNFYIECFNTKQKKPSGIFYSRAEYYAYLFLTRQKDYVLYTMKTRSLRNFLCESDCKVVDNKKTGEHNAVGWLMSIHDLKSSGIHYRTEYFDSEGVCRNPRAGEL